MEQGGLCEHQVWRGIGYGNIGYEVGGVMGAPCGKREGLWEHHVWRGRDCGSTMYGEGGIVGTRYEVGGVMGAHQVWTRHMWVGIEGSY